MEITTDLLRRTSNRLNYKWFDSSVNIIGIRTTLQVPDVFNDFLCCVFKQPQMPSGLSLIDKQKWLNKWGYKGKDGKVLAEDNKPGPNTDYALAQYEKNSGQERVKIYTITTEPGIYYQSIKLLNPKGCAVIKPGQYIGSYCLGFHKNEDHKALVQTGGKITIWRDNDKDGMAENLGVEESGFFGCNIHGAKRLTKTDKIGAYSAGCQVFYDWNDKEEFIRLCELFKNSNGGKFSYTLINEADLV
jgi:hypothetical protein